MSEQSSYLTKNGFMHLREELNYLLKVDRPRVVKDVSWAASNGDRSENGDYIYGKKRLRQIDSRVKYLLTVIEDSKIIDPLEQENKDKVYPETPSGMPGVQTIFPVMLDHVNNGKISLEQLINLMCENPCRIFGIKNKGYIKEGFDADLTIADMNKEVVIKDEMIASKCGWTPFNNYKVKGFPVGTIVNGNLVMSDGKVVLESKGQPLKF